MQIITGNTKIEKSQIQGREVYFKREDQNPSGSFKDRLMQFIWPDVATARETEIVTSSSGNFGISLLYFVKHQKPQLAKKLKVFIKDNLPPIKLKRLTKLVEDTNAELISVEKPKSAAMQCSRAHNALYLRGSAIDYYSQAYSPMATEITDYEEREKLRFDAIIICCSSGTAAQGLMQGLVAINRDLPVYIVQTSHIFSMAKEFDKKFDPDKDYQERTEANAISDRVAKRKSKVIELIEKLKGSGVVVDNREIKAALEILNKSDLSKEHDFTGNAALSLAGMFKLEQTGYNFSKPLVIISGN